MADVKIDCVPWVTPNYVLARMPARPRQEGFTDPPSWPLRDVDAMVLSRMCDDFRAEIFRKANKPDPKGEAR